MRSIQLIVLALACVWPGVARADRERLNAADLGVLQHVHDVHLMALDAANLAARQGTARVRLHAKQLRKDHRAADVAARKLVDRHDQALADHPRPATEGDQLAAEEHAVLMTKLAELQARTSTACTSTRSSEDTIVWPRTSPPTSKPSTTTAFGHC